MTTYTPGQVAGMIGVSVATLRRWSEAFAACLSAGANPPAGGHRSYTAGDVALFRIAHAQLAEGQSIAQVAGYLVTVELPAGADDSDESPERDARAAGVVALERLSDSLSLIANQKTTLDGLAGEVAELRRRVEVLEGERERKPLLRRLLGR